MVMSHRIKLYSATNLEIAYLTQGEQKGIYTKHESESEAFGFATRTAAINVCIELVYNSKFGKACGWAMVVESYIDGKWCAHSPRMVHITDQLSRL